MRYESQINEMKDRMKPQSSKDREWKGESDSKDSGTAYLGRTLDSSHLFKNQAQPFSLVVNVARLAFAPRGLSGNKHNVTQAQHFPPFP